MGFQKLNIENNQPKAWSFGKNIFGQSPRRKLNEK